jgi:adenylate cyclase
MSDPASDILVIGDARFDVARGLLTGADGQEILLRRQSLDVLKALARSSGEIVEKDTLMAEVWGDVAVTDDSLTQCIVDIRKALGDRDHKIVQTMPKRGYRLVPQTGAKATPKEAAPRRKLWPKAAGVAAVLIAALLGVSNFNRAPVEARQPAWLNAATEVTRAEPSIAVLPFENIEGDERWTRLGRGLAADIAGDLARNDWLYVTLPESLMNVAFGDIPEVRDLNVHYMLGGTIQAQGEKIRISARLTDVSTGGILWSETWTESQDDILSVQQQVIDRIGGSLAS